MRDNTILVTGGTSGIGRALAEAFHARGNQVIIAGRRQHLLDAITAARPGMRGMQFDFEAAGAGAAGVNFHAGVHNLRPGHDKAYTPITRSVSGHHRTAPLYYGILTFAQVDRGALVPAQLASASSELRAFAVRAPEGTLQVCLINKDYGRGARARIDPGRSFVAASVMRLAGPAAEATTGTTLGGASVDEFGVWSPATTEVVHSAGREITVDVPAASAPRWCPCARDGCASPQPTLAEIREMCGRRSYFCVALARM
jgi:short chain dehydrogenase